jgi:hypothetical protein
VGGVTNKYWRVLGMDMDMEPKYLTENAKAGNIYYFLLDKRYYFLKIVKMITDEGYFGYFIVVFEKSYSKLPDCEDEMDFTNIYQIKYKPKNSLLYILCEFSTPELKIVRNSMGYKDRDKYELHYWSNDKSSEYNPQIVFEAKDSFTWEELDEEENGVHLYPEWANIGYIFGRIESDIKNKNKKILNISPKYFPLWMNEVEPDIIIKMEKLFDKYLDECSKNGVEKALKKCVKSINKLDESEHFIYTIEAEDIFDKIFEVTEPFKVDESVITKVIEENRGW